MFTWWGQALCNAPYKIPKKWKMILVLFTSTCNRCRCLEGPCKPKSESRIPACLKMNPRKLVWRLNARNVETPITLTRNLGQNPALFEIWIQNPALFEIWIHNPGTSLQGPFWVCYIGMSHQDIDIRKLCKCSLFSIYIWLTEGIVDHYTLFKSVFFFKGVEQ